MAERKKATGILVRLDAYEQVKMMDDTECGILFRALLEYGNTGKEYDGDNRLIKIVFQGFKSVIDDNFAQYQRTCANRQAAAQEREEKKREEKEQLTQLSQLSQTPQLSLNKVKENKVKESKVNQNKEKRNKENEDKENINTLTCVNTHALRTSEQSKNFDVWLTDKCPYIAKHYTLPTDTELQKLVDQFGAKMVADVCEQIENRADLRKKYTNLYRTLLNWLKRESEKNMTQDERERQKRLASYAAVAAEFLNTEVRDERELSAAIPF